MMSLRDALLLRAAEILLGMVPYLEAELCPPSRYGLSAINDIAAALREECAEIHAEQDLSNLTGEAAP